MREDQFDSESQENTVQDDTPRNRYGGLLDSKAPANANTGEREKETPSKPGSGSDARTPVR